MPSICGTQRSSRSCGCTFDGSGGKFEQRLCHKCLGIEDTIRDQSDHPSSPLGDKPNAALFAIFVGQALSNGSTI